MVRKRKPYRDVRDREFLEIANMPLVENNTKAIEWMKGSKVMEYIFRQARNWNYIVATRLEDGNYIWKGVNYGEEDKKIIRESRTYFGKKMIQALTADGIDLMPPLSYRISYEKFDPLKSEVIRFLATKKNILKLVFVTAAYNGQIIRNADDTWIGKNNYRGDMDEKSNNQ